MPPNPSEITDYAQQILAAIDEDIAAGAVPASVRSFADLHTYLDANDYLQAAQVPHGMDQSTLDLVAAVEQEVTRLLRAPGRPYCNAHGRPHRPLEPGRLGLGAGQKGATMNPMPYPHDEDDPAGRGRLSVGDPVLRKTRLLARQCATCIFQPGNPMHLDAGRLHQLVAEATSTSGYIICHSTLPHYQPGARPGICRGFADRYSTWQLQVMARLWGFVEVGPPTEAATTGDQDGGTAESAMS